MSATFRIHPAIGIARVGNSPGSFYIAPDTTGGLPIECDENGDPVVEDGKEQPVTHFKDGMGRIRRQAARFRVFVYDEKTPDGREVKIGDTLQILNEHSGQVLDVRITDIVWTAYLANKKASWYAFEQTQGEHGYESTHPLRNAAIVNAQDRQQLIIDPGPRSVQFSDPTQRRAEFAATGQAPQSFPPPDIQPHAIATLGELICTQQDGANRLLVLGGYGNSGSMAGGFGNPKIEHYANNDGWFDDISDGPVTARLAYEVLKISGYPAPPDTPPGTLAVDDSAWTIVGYPRYAPEIVDMVTMDDVVFDVAVRDFAYAPYMYGVPPFDGKSSAPKPGETLTAWRSVATWNQAYRPYFWRDVWPILQRPFSYQYVMDLDPTYGGDPHETGSGGNFDPAQLSIPPYEGENPAEREHRTQMRMFLYGVLRKQGQENDLYAPPNPGINHRLFAMPLLCGDNPISNTAPSKFLCLTDTMLFILKQWAEGKFINERSEDIQPEPLHRGEGALLDSGALGSALGGAFCPGGEATWIMRNPAIYAGPYRINPAPYTPGALSIPPLAPGSDPQQSQPSLQAGLEPGDITKYDAVPWQADFNECTTQDIDVTYRDWNAIDPTSTGDPVQPIAQLTYWWPAHRPVYVNGAEWSPTAQTNAGDLQMVTAWATRGFVTRNPDPGPLDPLFILTETGD